MPTPVATIQTRIVNLLGLKVGDEQLSEGDLLADINQVYRFDIPELVREGRFRELATVTTPAGTATVLDLNVATVSPTGPYGAILGTWARYKLTAETTSTPLGVYTSERDFWESYDPASTTQARPTGILILETTFYLRPIPAAAGFTMVNALRYRAALTQGGNLDVDYEAKTIEYMAAGYAARRIGDDDTAVRMETLAGPLVDKLKSLAWRSASTPIIVGRGF